jgi:hypothetical protein
MSDDKETMILRLANELRGTLAGLGSYPSNEAFHIRDLSGVWDAATNDLAPLDVNELSAMLDENGEFTDAFVENRVTINRDTARHLIEHLHRHLTAQAGEMEQDRASAIFIPRSALTTDDGFSLTTEDGKLILADTLPAAGTAPVAVQSTTAMVDSNVACLTIRATEWVKVTSTHDLRAKIEQVCRNLEEVVQYAGFCNVPPGERGLSDAEREQLIGVLKTVLKVLEAPLVERGILESAADGLKQGMGKVAEKGTEKALLAVGTLAIEHLHDLIALIF